MKKFILAIYFIIFIFSCNAPSAKFVKKTKTVIAYLAADNDLSDVALFSINKMEEGFLDIQGINFIVYLDRASTAITPFPVLLKIRKDSSSKIESTVVKIYEENSSANVDIFTAVLNDCKELYPADSYDLIIWSHSTAWLPKNCGVKKDKTFTNILSMNGDGNEYMEVIDFARALPDNMFETIIFDSCYMANIEVCYELRDKCKYILGCQTGINVSSFPYQILVKEILKHGVDNGKIANEFYNFYSTTNLFVNEGALSIIKTEHLSEFISFTKKIIDGNSIIATLDISNIQSSVYLVNGEVSYLYDLEDFMKNIMPIDSFSSWKYLFEKVVIYSVKTKYFQKLDLTKISGLSIYIPTDWTKDLQIFYKNLNIYKDGFYANFF